MKKLGVLIILFLIISQFTNAQSNIKFGLKGGLNYANFSNTEINTNAITSYHAGILIEFFIFDNLAIQPELLYSTVGAKYDTIISDIKNELGYISLPILAKFKLSEFLFLEAGPQGSFLLSKKDDVIKDYNEFDFSVNGGLGLNISKNLFISARYNLGVTEIARDADAKNSVIQVSAGIIF